MTATLGPGDVERFRALVARRLGLHFEDSKLGELEDTLRRRLEASHQPAEVYFSRFERPEVPREEMRALARELTVAETYFFRNIAQFRALAEIALPERMRVSERRRLSILSAGCASGEEPFSLAMLASERVADPTWTISIRGVDLNPAALDKAAQGRYSTWALRETPPEVQRRWFTSLEKELVLDESIRASVTFEERNLAVADPDLWPPSFYDVVFCRNVLMYFTPQNAVALVGRIATALAPGGYLFLGHAETLRGLSHEFHLCHTHGTFYYQRRGAALEREAESTLATSDALRDPARWSAPVAVAADTWIEEIRRASDRIQVLAQTSPLTQGSDRKRARPTSPPRDLGLALALLEKERYDDALEIVHGLPPQFACDPDVLLLRATLLTHGGRLGDAEQACAQLLGLDDLNAGAHYLLALCREGLGDPQGAVHHDQVAAYLDPSFAMPRLHMGLLARRAGNREGACRELAQAVELLGREETARLLLFGGGFSRDALIALCRAELVTGGRTG